MLILDRSEGERIVISTSDGPITITMLERRRGAVRFGISAPAKCIITRPECHQNQEKKEATCIHKYQEVGGVNTNYQVFYNGTNAYILCEKCGHKKKA